MSAYDVDGSRILIPQRVDAEHQAVEAEESLSTPTPKGRLVEGAEDFAAAIEESPEELRLNLRRLHDWAISLEREGLVKLSTYQGVSNRWTLLPRLPTENAGLVTIWNEGGAYLQFWGSVFARRAAESLPLVERIIAPIKIGQGNTTREISDALLETLTQAY